MLWLLLAIMYVCMMVLVSSRVNSYAGAAGIGIGIYAALALVGVWTPLQAHSPAGLLQAGPAILRGEGAAILWPVVSTVVLILLFRRGSDLVFSAAGDLRVKEPGDPGLVVEVRGLEPLACAMRTRRSPI